MLPSVPFRTEDFSLRGGGIDFLGLRYVNLHMVGDYLIPELNNVTRDMGMFCLGAWIPWKFRQICKKDDYTPKNYLLFRERVEVAISLNMADHCISGDELGLARNRVGVTQKMELPGELTFKNAKRSKDNTFYTPALYGPSLRAINLVQAYQAKAEGGKVLNIAVVADDEDTNTIVTSVDGFLSRSTDFSKLQTLDSVEFGKDAVDDLGKHGLNVTCYRLEEFDSLKRSFLRKLLPADDKNPGYARTLTARLMLTTLHAKQGIDSWQIRNAWYTGMFNDGSALQVPSELEEHRQYWAYFMSRQYQRYIIELFLWCFESALSKGCRSVDEVVEDAIQHMAHSGSKLPSSFRALTERVGDFLGEESGSATSVAWNNTVHGGHRSFEHVWLEDEDNVCYQGLVMMAGWYWRMLYRNTEGTYDELLRLGGADRFGMKWFLGWVNDRLDLGMREFLKDVFSNLVFSQHMRIALSRFDGKAQRLRFMLGDEGIEPTTSALKSLGKLSLPMMPDRLDTLTELMSDADLLVIDEDGAIRLGARTLESVWS
jgi:hypothetical protein